MHTPTGMVRNGSYRLHSRNKRSPASCKGKERYRSRYFLEPPCAPSRNGRERHSGKKLRKVPVLALLAWRGYQLRSFGIRTHLAWSANFVQRSDSKGSRFKAAFVAGYMRSVPVIPTLSN